VLPELLRAIAYWDGWHGEIVAQSGSFQDVARRGKQTEPLAIPRVNGRHQNKSLARARKQRAIELRMTGMTYQPIADAMGYANAGSVYSIIKQAQEQHVASAVEDQRQLELERLNDAGCAVAGCPARQRPCRARGRANRRSAGSATRAVRGPGHRPARPP